ncbi:hypothetical protein BCV72DRAFT_196988 [Rhizopus microsporus var. microsporus]|uniref:Uncharacterized protein n=1 Tax=Rhizopus microsporus var. microsporus TaxID=86635 RepID=A0A1X0RJ94_RHIZD|nr:hypothetical protein BCV72DRAFT_196988 [Rhizopus microsporus var. microsporus]
MSQRNEKHLPNKRAPWAKTEPRQPQASSSRSYNDNQPHSGPSRPQTSTSTFREPLRERRTVPRQEPTRPEKGRPLTNKFHPPWLTSQLSSSNVEEGTPNLTVDEIKGTVKRLMRGFRCKVPYAYHHRLMHASLSRPTEFVRQIPVPSIKYLKKESWPVFNKYIGHPLDRTALKRRLHIAADPDYVVPESERRPIESTSSRQHLAREPGEIIFEAQRKYPPKIANRHQYPQASSSSLSFDALEAQYQAAKRVDSLGNNTVVMSFLDEIKENSKFLAPNPNTVHQQDQAGRPAPAVQPSRKPTPSISNTLRIPDRSVRPASSLKPAEEPRLPDRPKKIEPSSSTATPRTTITSSDKKPQISTAPIASSSKTTGQSLLPESKLKSRAPWSKPTVDNNVHPLATSGAVTKRKTETVAPTTISPSKKKFKTMFVQRFVQYSSLKSPILYVGLRNLPCDVRSKYILNDTLTNFSFLFNLDPLKVVKVVVKQKKALSVLEGKGVINFVPGRPPSAAQELPSTSQHIVQLASTSTSSKGKGKEVPSHSPPSAAGKKLPSSKPASDDTAVPFTTPNKSAAVATELSEHEEEDMELEEGETISPSPSPQHHNEADVDESASRSLNKGTTANPKQSTKRTISSDSGRSTKRKQSDDKSSSEEKDQVATNDKGKQKVTETIKEEPTDNNPDTTSLKKTLSATAPNANTMEQYKVFTFMFRNLAHTYKKRGDSEKDKLISALNHFHAFCNYIISYYYNEKQKTDVTPSESVTAWKSLFPFADMLLAKLKAQEQYLLYGVCLRLVAMMRFGIFSKMQGEIHGVLAKHLKTSSASDSLKYVKMSHNLLEEYNKAMTANASSEKYFGYQVLASKLPLTFKQVCVDGNLLSGITVGGEAGVEVSPMFPFELNASLLHAAIGAKCILSEFVSLKKLEFKLINDTDEYM